MACSATSTIGTTRLVNGSSVRLKTQMDTGVNAAAVVVVEEYALAKYNPYRNSVPYLAD